MTVEQELWALAAEGDLRAVKRRYSQALKVTRPEDDPNAFQRLHDAYQRAVARCEAVGSGGDLHREPLEQGVVVPPPPSLQSNVQVLHSNTPLQRQPDDVLAELLQQAATLEVMEFARWLHRQAGDWSLDTRDYVSRCVLAALRGQSAPMRSDNAAALFRALGWDDVSCQINPRELQWLAELANGAWLQQPAQHRALAATVQSRGRTVIPPEEIPTALDLLRRPRSHARNLRMAMFGWSGERLVGVMEVLGFHPGAPLPKGIDPGQAAFWSGAAQPFHRISLQVDFLRAAAVGVALALLAGLVARFTGIIDWAFNDVVTAWRTPLAMLCALLAPALVIVAFSIVPAWQNAREEDPVPLPWLRILAVPLLIGAVVAGWAAWMHFGRSGGGIPALCAIWLSARWVLRVARHRFHVRRGRMPSSYGIAEIVRMAAAAMIFPALVASLAYWLLDLVHHGRVLRWRALPNG